MGTWLASNGQSFYGTRGGPWKPTQSIASTRKGNAVFLHLLRSEDRRVELPDLPAKIMSATLPDGGKVEVRQQGGKLLVTLAARWLDPNDTIVKLELDRSAMDIPVLEMTNSE
jgi:alpha-L-fucosidase